MKLSQPTKNLSINRTKPKDRLTFITDDHDKLAIPVGPRFQADVPSWTPPSSNSCLTSHDINSLESQKWLGTRVWPLKGFPQGTGHDKVGRGRSSTCKCAIPGSIRCVRLHVYEKKLQLQIDLGPVFWKWKLDITGEGACRIWSEDEKMKCDDILKMKLAFKGEGFMKSAKQCFPSHSRGRLVEYYLNVHIPRRISVQTRLKHINTDTDDDDDDDDNGAGGGGGQDVIYSKESRKRLHADFTSSSRKYVKTMHLESCWKFVLKGPPNPRRL